MNIGLLMILKRGDATAHKISFGDCEAKRNGAEPNQTALDSMRALKSTISVPPSRRILRRLFFGPISDDR
jgi:hypothetical protein